MLISYQFLAIHAFKLVCQIKSEQLGKDLKKLGVEQFSAQ